MRKAHAGATLDYYELVVNIGRAIRLTCSWFLNSYARVNVQFGFADEQESPGGPDSCSQLRASFGGSA